MSIYSDGVASGRYHTLEHVDTIPTTYHSRAAQEAERYGYGDRRYWDYLERHAQELSARFSREGNARRAVEMLTRTLSESLAGNEGA